ncbi:hypothetical protein Mapa_014929 [Marchantia paleacea]|nr:hypothetical protein Mapa_014929 [Marchantia paleacea]
MARSGRLALSLLGVSQILLGVHFVFIMSAQSSMAIKYKDFNERELSDRQRGTVKKFTPLETGTIKNAWPEYEGLNVYEVKKLLEDQGVSVQIEPPRDGSPPFFAGEPNGVWLYTDGNDRVLGVPSRGLWHFNRLRPGWPDLVNIAFKKAAEIITQEQVGVEVVYGPKNFPRTKDFSPNRVFLDVDKYGNVAFTPRLG